MKKINFKGFFLLTLLLSFFLLNGCEVLTPDIYKLSLTMKNNSSEEIHLWTNKEGMDASNKLAPGVSRTRTLTYELGNSPTVDITVSAGKNGTKITERNFTISVPKTTSITVIYSGGTLTLAK